MDANDHRDNQDDLNLLLSTDELRRLATVGDRGELRLLLHEEVLEPIIREYVRGRALVRKRVESVDDTLELDVKQQHPVVERVVVDREVDAAPAPYWDGDTYVMPVVQEEIVVTRRLVLKEEVRITLDASSEKFQVPTSIRREIVEVIEEETVASDSPASS